MKTTIRKTLWLLLIAGVFTSCSKNDGGEDTGPDNELSGDLLLIEQTKNGQTISKFEYDERNRATIHHLMDETSGDLHTVTFTYDDRNRLIAADRMTDEVYLSESYTYEDDDKPVAGVWTFPDSDGSDVVVPVQYTYTENTVAETVFHEGAAQTSTYTFDTKGNLATVLIGAALQEYGDYDDKKSTHTNYPWAWKISYANNPRSVKIAGMVDQIWEYTYNDAGYPVSAKVYNRGSDEVAETHEYRYKKAN
ncbi:hypothetical protein [Parapedobacter indicus]|uniref:YD repeat-containing protein n=1 Tax=Parapedobacter indicus TaxID=1477437 RepID=A0A1I3N653_9SPHI|nr:hypothetical protein [Parapedobacter indicus]PPL00892.1 hypothetical protein CLV26_107112 [Parapedobacter indicus]SFJ04814.1 hypothetical protein SAMN05444682_107112 [Parapedobacter indicus]